MQSTYETIKIEKQNGITWLYHNRPDKRNAMSPQLHDEMNDALDGLATDPETEILVLTGAGDAFCAGQDLKLFFRDNADKPIEKARAQHASNQWRWHKLISFPKPTIAMVNGYCFGGAFTQLCACDLALAADEATFGLSEVNWGMIPGGIVGWNIVEMLNQRDAMYYAMTGLPFDGRKAAEIKLVNASVPLARLREETVKLADLLKEKDANALRATKEAIRAVRYMTHDQAFQFLASKLKALQAGDGGDGSRKGMSQFLDDKTYKPGLGTYSR